MINITGYIHQEKLHEIIQRWMYDNLLETDLNNIVQLIQFNNIYVTRYLELFTDELLKNLFPAEIKSIRTHNKGELKDAIVTAPPYYNARIDELIKTYNTSPGQFYRETPFNGFLYFIQMNGASRYIGSFRMKRIRRLAEKSARRIIDGIFVAIKKQADKLADARANKIGIPREQLITSPSEMIAEFHSAEERLINELHNKNIVEGLDDIYIHDLAGIKVILEGDDKKRLIKYLEQRSDCTIYEEERHAGAYNATNLIVEYSPPKNRIISKELDISTIQSLQQRGFNKEFANDAFLKFVKTGEEKINLEIITYSYQEMLESEIGTCMHEDRIIEQRKNQRYHGQLAKNIEYLMSYLFTIPMSTITELEEIPIKLWRKYLPDFFDDVMKKLFEISTRNGFNQ